MRSVAFRFFLLFAAVAVASTLSSPALAKEPGRDAGHILALYSYGHGGKGIALFDAGFIETLDAAGVTPNNVFYEYLDLERNADDPQYVPALRNWLLREYAGRHIDVIVTVQQPALRFLQDELRGLAPGAPVITLQAPVPPEATARTRQYLSLFSQFDLEGTLDRAMELFPDTQRVVVVSGASESDRRMAVAGVSAARRAGRSLEVETTFNFSLDQLLLHVSKLPPKSIIVFTQYNRDSAGTVRYAYEVEAKVIQVANAPVFGLYDFNLVNHGVGGSVVGVRGLGVSAARAALDLMDGRRKLVGPVTVEKTYAAPVFDWQQIQRWGGDPSRLPAGTRFVNRKPTLWEEYKGYAVAALAVVLLQSLLIAALLVARSRRARAEKARKQAMEKLDAEKERLAVTLRSIGDAVIATDDSARITVFNSVAEALTGWNADDAVGRPVQEVFRIINEETGQPAVNPVDRVLREGIVVGLANHTALIARDGTQRPIADSGAPIRDSRSVVRGVVLVFRDQTEERRTRQALEETTQRAKAHAAELQAVLDAVPAAVFITRDRDARHMDANRYCAELFRVPQATNVSKSAPSGEAPTTFRVLQDGVEVAAEDLPVQVAANQGVDVRGYECDLTFQDGTVRNLVGNATPLRTGSGDVTGAVGAFVDITELKRAKERFRALIENATDMIVVLDGEARINFWSPSATEALGWRRDEVLGKSVFDYVHPDDQSIIVDAIVTGKPKPGATARVSVRHRHRDGTWRLLEAWGRNLLHDPAVHGIVVNTRDITEHQRLEEQFRQAQKLESIGRLAGGVAHDFNNLLTIIFTCGEELKEDITKGVAGRLEDVQEICAAAQRAGALTRQLLAFARKQVVEPAPIDLNTLVRGSHKMLCRLLGEDVVVRMDLQPDAWTLFADAGQIEQVILNLAINARDAMPRGGDLVIETRNAAISAEEADEDADLLPGDWVQLRICDTGMGMTPEVKEHLFEPFFTTKEPGKGTGLGLATVYGIVKQAGGHVHVESEPGRGTTVCLCFPRAEDVSHETPEPVSAEAQPGSETVLVVEDEPQVRKVIVRALRAGGYQVTEVAHPRLALEMSNHDVVKIRLLVTDVVMPEIDGRSLADELRRRNPDLRVLFVSGYAQDVITARGALEPDELLGKPFTATSLLARVRTILDKSCSVARVSS